MISSAGLKTLPSNYIHVLTFAEISFLALGFLAIMRVGGMPQVAGIAMLSSAGAAFILDIYLCNHYSNSDEILPISHLNFRDGRTNKVIGLKLFPQRENGCFTLKINDESFHVYTKGVSLPTRLNEYFFWFPEGCVDYQIKNIAYCERISAEQVAMKHNFFIMGNNYQIMDEFLKDLPRKVQVFFPCVLAPAD